MQDDSHLGVSRDSPESSGEQSEKWPDLFCVAIFSSFCLSEILYELHCSYCVKTCFVGED